MKTLRHGRESGHPRFCYREERRSFLKKRTKKLLLLLACGCETSTAQIEHKFFCFFFLKEVLT
jgi:hypothetical protein